MQRCFILTRPPKDSAQLAGLLRQSGSEVVIAPMLEIVQRRDVKLPGRDQLQAIVFTSANGVDALMAQPDARELAGVPVIAVGQSSADAAHDAGFRTVVASGGDVNELVRSVVADCAPHEGAILYPSGVHTAGDLEARLREKGYVVERCIVYEAKHAQVLPEAAKIALERIGDASVVLYSPRTAHTWCSLIERSGLHRKRLGTIRYYCLSWNVANAVAEHFGDDCRVVVAGAPNEQAMLKAMKLTGTARTAQGS